MGSIEKVLHLLGDVRLCLICLGINLFLPEKLILNQQSVISHDDSNNNSYRKFTEDAEEPEYYHATSAYIIIPHGIYIPPLNLSTL